MIDTKNHFIGKNGECLLSELFALCVPEELHTEIGAGLIRQFRNQVAILNRYTTINEINVQGFNQFIARVQEIVLFMVYALVCDTPGSFYPVRFLEYRLHEALRHPKDINKYIKNLKSAKSKKEFRKFITR